MKRKIIQLLVVLISLLCFTSCETQTNSKNGRFVTVSAPCEVIIESGKCPVLINHFKEREMIRKKFTKKSEGTFTNE